MPHGPPPAWASNVSQVDLVNLVCISPESMFEVNSSHCSETTAGFVVHAHLGLADRSTCAPLLFALIACLFVLPRGRVCAFDRDAHVGFRRHAPHSASLAECLALLDQRTLLYSCCTDVRSLRICVSPNPLPTFDGCTIWSHLPQSLLPMSPVQNARQLNAVLGQ